MFEINIYITKFDKMFIGRYSIQYFFININSFRHLKQKKCVSNSSFEWKENRHNQIQKNMGYLLNLNI